MKKRLRFALGNLKVAMLFLGMLSTSYSYSQYCVSNATSVADEDIFNVTVGILNNSSTCTQTGGPGSLINQYSNYTNVTPALPIPTLPIGISIPMSVGIGTCGGNYGNMSKVYIDFNQNNSFADAGELVYQSPSATTGPHTESFSFTVPFSALSGMTRMRVVCRETTVITSFSDCGTYTWGETEDYTVMVGTPLPNDAGIVGFVNPQIPTCVFNDSVSVILRNYGTDTLTSASINWSWNSVNQTAAFWTGSLAPQAQATVYVGSVMYGSGDDLCAWTTNPNGTIENPSGSYNDSSCITGLLTGLSGIYTIGGATPDFPDVVTAINALNFAGICGPTTFNIRTGSYADQFNLGQVIGMSDSNTVTFRSEAGHRDSVTFDYTATALATNYVVKFDNADYYRFEHMTLKNSGASFGTVMLVNGGSDYNVVYDCTLESTISSTSTNGSVIFSSNGNDEYNRFENCTVLGGSYGVYWYGTSTASLERGTEFINNKFENSYYTGMRLYYQDAPVLTHNRVFGVSSYTTRYGIYCGYCDKAAEFTYNSIESDASSFFYYGMYIYYSDATSNGRGLIANNMITVGTPTTTALIYGLDVYYTGYYNIYNNSVNCLGTSATSRSLYLYYGGGNNVKNNTFTNNNGYAVYTVSPYAINEMDYNNLYTTGPILAYYDIANTATMADWQLASGYDGNGLNVNPGYYSDFDLHVCSDSLNNAGTPLAMITDDIDGQARNASTPDIGADEFAPLGLPGFVGPDALVCTGETVTLYAGAPADNVLWSTGDTTHFLTIATPGTYTVSVIGACGISFDTVVVTASALSYTGYLMADTTTFCTGGSALLTSSMMANTYSWTGGSTNDSLVVTAGGTYTLNISDACGTGTESIVITENSAPTAGFTSTTSFLTAIFTNTSTTGGNPTYSWNFGDGGTSTQMNPSHVYTTVGTFTVTLTVTNDCGTNVFTSTVTSSNLGLEEVVGVGTIAVYPNPSNGVFQIDFNTNNDMNISVLVTNVLGESVYVKDLGSINGMHKDAIDITNAAPGVYYVTIVSNNEKVMTSKLVKQ